MGITRNRRVAQHRKEHGRHRLGRQAVHASPDAATRISSRQLADPSRNSERVAAHDLKERRRVRRWRSGVLRIGLARWILPILFLTTRRPIHADSPIVPMDQHPHR